MEALYVLLGHGRCGVLFYAIWYTVLGVFTIIMLVWPSVKALFEPEAPNAS